MNVPMQFRAIFCYFAIEQLAAFALSYKQLCFNINSETEEIKNRFDCIGVKYYINVSTSYSFYQKFDYTWKGFDFFWTMETIILFLG